MYDMRYFNSVRSDGKILKRNGVSWSLRSQKLQENLVLWKEWIFSALLINSFQNCKVEACSHFILACEWCFTLYSYRLWAHSLFDMIPTGVSGMFRPKECPLIVPTYLVITVSYTSFRLLSLFFEKFVINEMLKKIWYLWCSAQGVLKYL